MRSSWEAKRFFRVYPGRFSGEIDFRATNVPGGLYWHWELWGDADILHAEPDASGSEKTPAAAKRACDKAARARLKGAKP